MKTLIAILVMSFKDVLKPKILSIIILPFLGSFLIWGLITWGLWDWIINIGTSLYQFELMQKLVELLSPYFTLSANPLIAVTAAAFIFVVIFPAALITALLMTSVLLVPVLVSELRKTDFPTLIKKSSSVFAGTGTSLAYSIKYFASWIGSLPLWLLIPGGPIVVPYLLISWFNSRLFAWEVLTEVSTPDEIRVFVHTYSKQLFGLGLVTSVLYYIPVINLVAPVITSAAFARYCLQKYSAQ